MQFDLFDAIERMKSKIGDSSEILVFSDYIGYCIRLRHFECGGVMSVQFPVSYEELNDSNVRLMNIRFHRALQDLAEAMHPTPTGE